MAKSPWEDLSDSGYSTGYQTKKECFTSGCKNIAGTFWFDDLCPVCTRDKLRKRAGETRSYRDRVYGEYT